MKASKSRNATQAQRLEFIRQERGLQAALVAYAHLERTRGLSAKLWRIRQSWWTWATVSAGALLWLFELLAAALQIKG